MKKKMIILGATLWIVLCMISGCSASSPEAEKGDYVIDKEEQKILVATDISSNDAENHTFFDLKKRHVEMVYYIVEDAQLYNEVTIGDKVKITPKTNDKGEYVVMQSDPPQVIAGKIERLSQ
ncbi:Protein of unknown function [Cohnella sp. OV330]|uniref:DUF3221 domain-containing protein n=1 Tax=Cohnella sp. OV330 TaxID=1855288 RepID=UPI0008ED9FEF|nr:DUF3221 domain-containing protein [Cohnella sp. OV330]SFB04586.1 Protein of unknown function [Cohnella sp. OV330]